jgi:hypothetical protein
MHGRYTEYSLVMDVQQQATPSSKSMVEPCVVKVELAGTAGDFFNATNNNSTLNQGIAPVAHTNSYGSRVTHAESSVVRSTHRNDDHEETRVRIPRQPKPAGRRPPCHAAIIWSATAVANQHHATDQHIYR